MIDTTLFSIGEVAAMVGISAHTIRAWERRYRLLTPHRTPSGQRRYTMADVELLQQVKLAVAGQRLSLRLAVGRAQGALEEPAEAVEDDDRLADVPGLPVEEGGMWRAVADLQPELILILDGTGSILDANIACARVTGTLRGRLRGTRLLNLVDPYDRAKAVRIYRPRLTQRRGWELNLRTPVRAGLFSFDCWPIRDGERRCLVMMGRDLSPPGEESLAGPVDLPAP
jgi:PAS domain S-box-containing protein